MIHDVNDTGGARDAVLLSHFKSNTTHTRILTLVTLILVQVLNLEPKVVGPEDRTSFNVTGNTDTRKVLVVEVLMRTFTTISMHFATL